MENNSRKEDHPRFQRAQNAMSSQIDEHTDSYTRMTDEELTRATEEYLNKSPDDKEEKTDVSQSSKRKSEDEEVKDNQAQTTSKAEKYSIEEETRTKKRVIERRCKCSE